MAVRLPAPRRRRQLLDVALRCFASRGYHRTAMDDIAEAAGVTKPVLYQHFGSKRGLYLALVDDVGAQLAASITESAARAGRPRAQVEAGFTAYLDAVSRRPDAFRLLFSGGTPGDAEFADALRRVEATIAQAIAPLIAADIDEEQRLVVADAIVGMAEGAVRSRLRTGEPFDARRVARQLADLAWGGLRNVRRV